jgi:hypothetical protein
MIPWTDIKRAAIRINLDRKANGRTVDEMLEEVRALIAGNGDQFTGPTVQRSGGYEFRTADGMILEYDDASNTWQS